MTEPLSDELLAEIRDDAQTCLECGILFDWPPAGILALLSRLDKAEAGLKLVDEDRQRRADFADWLERICENPPPPSPELRKLMADYRQGVAEGRIITDLPPPPSES